tara:strand:- start:628 stop:798 length:171 start_codon:yes stop_codon:yes gene_type:complete
MTTPQTMTMTAISRHVDGLEVLVDDDTIANASPVALCNLLARLSRVQRTIESAARK